MCKILQMSQKRILSEKQKKLPKLTLLYLSLTPATRTLVLLGTLVLINSIEI